jgi:cleavage stimulation factor subunit 3
MAEKEAEQAFFQAQPLEADTAVPVNPGEQATDNFDDEDEYDPSRPFDDQYQDVEPGTEQTEEATEEEQLQRYQQQDDDELEPESEVTAPNPTALSDMDTGLASDAPDPAQNPSRAESQKSTPVPPTGVSAQPQTRTIGGFDVEDDEDENEDDKEEADYEPPAVLGVDDSNAMPMTMSEDPSSGNQNHTTSPDVSSHLVQPSASVLDVANSSYSPAPVSNIDPSVSGSLQWAHDPSMQNSTVPTPVPDSPSSKGRLSHDRVGILQDRVDEDPRGDLSAWLELIAEHRARNRLDSAREVYERFLKEFPMAVSLRFAFRMKNTDIIQQADQWVAYATMESELNELFRLEQIFNRTLLTIPSVQLWSVYLDYVRRRNPLTTDTSGQARRTISSAYDLAIQYVGMDKDSGNIWNDYVEFIRSGPGTVGGAGWQDQQKMDLLRKAYQKALCVPTQVVNSLWKEYDQFEMGLNKLTVRILQFLGYGAFKLTNFHV